MQADSWNRYVSALKTIKKLLSNKRALNRYFNDRQIKMLADVFNLLEKHLDMLAKDDNDKVRVSERQITAVRDACRIMFNVTFRTPITKELRDFIVSFTGMITTWNNTLTKNPIVERLSNDTRLLITNQLNMATLVRTSTTVLQRLNKMLQYERPGHKVATHWLKILLDENEGGEKKENATC